MSFRFVGNYERFEAIVTHSQSTSDAYANEHGAAFAFANAEAAAETEAVAAAEAEKRRRNARDRFRLAIRVIFAIQSAHCKQAQSFARWRSAQTQRSLLVRMLKQTRHSSVLLGERCCLLCSLFCG